MKKGMICNILLAGATMFALIACGAGDPGGLAGGGIGGTGISVGRITAIGSVTVNGIKFETDTATISVDGKDGVLNDLEVGMLVAVEGTFNADGMTGMATSVVFRDNLEGPVTSVALTAQPQTVSVLGQTVMVDATTDIYDASRNKITLNDIIVGNSVEVSGFTDAAGAIHATYIKVKAPGETEIEVKGTISELNVISWTFKIGTLTVAYSGDTNIEINGGLRDGLFVEVKSTTGIDDAGVLIASEVETEDEIFSIAHGDEGDKVEIEGIVTNSLSSENKFEVNGQPVQVTSATQFEGSTSQADIILGARLEVEGTIDANGVLIAREISIESGDGSGEGDNNDSLDDEPEASGH